MKKSILVLSIISLFSCEKAEVCKTCTTVITCNGAQQSKTTFEACGDVLRDIDGNVVTSTASYAGITVTCVSRTMCR